MSPSGRPKGEYRSAQREGAPVSTLLRVAGLRRSFGGLRAVDGLDLTVARGEIVGLLGPNGSGKTTAMNLISGALRPNGGVIELDGEPIHGLPAHRVARRGIARSFQLVRVPPALTCLENVVTGLAFRPGALWGAPAHARARELLQRVHLLGKEDVTAGALTYIEHKRLELARALALEPKLLLLDEWLAGLNPTELQEGIALVRDIRGSGITVLLVEHVMEAVRALCDRCVVMSAGRQIAEGPTAEALAHPAVLDAYLGAPEPADV
jgi:ABC-type branched-subunit amino acid transport system ATPase component